MKPRVSVRPPARPFSSVSDSVPSSTDEPHRETTPTHQDQRNNNRQTDENTASESETEGGERGGLSPLMGEKR